eukprot:snap_masked-scaffold_3-processed-gene-20.13-mRNA-1 protein AED:0.15 eAED:1.00 QI:0/-1/0/1/-1/1/1/0/315
MCSPPLLFDEEAQNCSSNVFLEYEGFASFLVIFGLIVRIFLLVVWFQLLLSYISSKRKLLFKKGFSKGADLFFAKQNLKAMSSVGISLITGIYFAKQGYLLKTKFDSYEGKILGVNCIICWTSVALRFIYFSPVMAKLLGIEGEATTFYKNLILRFRYMIYLYWMIFIPIFLLHNVSLSLFLSIAMGFNVLVNLLMLYPIMKLLALLIASFERVILHMKSSNDSSPNTSSYEKFLEKIRRLRRSVFWNNFLFVAVGMLGVVPNFNVKKEVMLFATAITCFWPLFGMYFFNVFSNYILPGKESCFSSSVASDEENI